MKVKLITDSASDITPEDEERYGIDIMPFDITLGNESLKERVDFTAAEFLEMIDKPSGMRLFRPVRIAKSPIRRIVSALFRFVFLCGGKIFIQFFQKFLCGYFF